MESEIKTKKRWKREERDRGKTQDLLKFITMTNFQVLRRRIMYSMKERIRKGLDWARGAPKKQNIIRTRYKYYEGWTDWTLGNRIMTCTRKRLGGKDRDSHIKRRRHQTGEIIEANYKITSRPHHSLCRPWWWRKWPLNGIFRGNATTFSKIDELIEFVRQTHARVVILGETKLCGTNFISFSANRLDGYNIAIHRMHWYLQRTRDDDPLL